MSNSTKHRVRGITGGYDYARDDESGEFVILDRDGSVLSTHPDEDAIVAWIDEQRRVRIEAEHAARQTE